MQNQQFFRPMQPGWLRLKRTGNLFQGYASSDGVNWYLTFTTTLPMSDCVYLTMFTESTNVNTTTTGVFQNLSLDGGVIPLVQQTPSEQQFKNAFRASNNATFETSFEENPLGLLAATNIEAEVWPNPTAESINVKMPFFNGKAVDLEIRNALGQLIRPINIDAWDGTRHNINVSDLRAGVYFLSINVSDTEVRKMKFIKQ